MDRSLKFFTDLSQKKANIDSKTGLPQTSVSVEYSVNNFDPNNPTDGTTSIEKKTVNYTVLMSGQTDTKFVNYMGNSNVNDYDKYTISPEEESDIRLSNIIQWSQKNHPALALKSEHFVYLKDFNVYPANRLMILRRFNGPVNHNLFNSKAKPQHTMVTYYNLDESPLDIEFNEKWTDFTGSFMNVLQDVIGINFTDIPGISDLAGSKFGQFASQSNLGQELLVKIGQKLGFISKGGIPYGDPNMIYEAKIRDVSGKDVSSGLESKIKIEFETTYVMNEIPGGPDAKVAMLDIIANVVHMGTSPERFYITGAAASTLNNLITAMRTGNISGIFNGILTTIKEIITGLIQKITEVATNVIDAVKKSPSEALDVLLGGLESFAGDILKTRYSRYKWQLQGAVAALSGAYTAPWHISIGNPKFPWFSCGNMVVTKVTMEAGGELAYNDMFSELKVKISLESGRSFGANGLTELFNAGRGRIYDQPAKIQNILAPQDSTKKILGNPNNVEEAPTGTGIPVNNDVDQINVINNTTAFTNNNVDQQSSNINQTDTNKKVGTATIG
jgi:hypothetical protein